MYLKALEISTTDHCNLKCAQCNHASPHLARRFTPITTIRNDLEALRPAVQAGELRIAGGEPLQHPELVALTRTLRALHIADRLVLITNGVLLHVTAWDFLEFIDVLQVSRYPGVSMKCCIRDLEAACDRHGVELEVRDMARFSKTLLTRRNESRALVSFIHRHCALAHQWSCHLVHDGRLYRCTPAAFAGARLAKVGIELDSSEDGLPLHEGGDLAARVRDYLTSDTPLAACAYCLGSVGRQVPSRQLSKQALARELEEDRVPAIAALGLRGLVQSLVMPQLERLISPPAKRRGGGSETRS